MFVGLYPLVNIQKAIEHGHLQWNYKIKIVIFHSYVNVYQRITPMFTSSIYPPPWPVKQLIDLANDLHDLVIPHSYWWRCRW